MARILVIDDDVLVRKSLSRLFLDLGHDVLLAGSLAEGEAQARKGVDVIYLDLDLPDGDGLKAIDSLSATDRHPEVIVITGMGSSYGAQKTLQSHAWDYISKPASPQAVKESLESALLYRKESMREHAAASDFDYCGIIGEDASMQRSLRDIAKAAKSDASVLISGETGVGKELTARAIHANSSRVGALFIVVDCSNLTDTLVESMLYGHLKGSFTGAHTDRRGLVAEADGGTLFLDEVGELSLSLQKSFLRVLQERRFRPVGSRKEQSSDFRVVAATNRDLNRMVQEGAFRSDLLFRIRTVDVIVPPLRERGKDKERLAAHFIHQLCDRYGLKVKKISEELSNIINTHQWPGNVRELANVMEAAVIAAGNDPVIYPKHLPTHVRLSYLDEQKKLQDPRKPSTPVETSEVRDSSGILSSYSEHKALRDREYFTRLLEASEYDITKASLISGLSIPSVYRHLALAGISPKNKRRAP
jgi:two-component system NtrC family response regulator